MYDEINILPPPRLRCTCLLRRNSSISTERIKMTTTVPTKAPAIQTLPLPSVLGMGYAVVLAGVSVLSLPLDSKQNKHSHFMRHYGG